VTEQVQRELPLPTPAPEPKSEAQRPCASCGCERNRESGPCEGHGKDELRTLRDELRKQRKELLEQREEVRELLAQLADAYIKQDGLGNFIQTPDGIFLIRGWGFSS
jgi:DNA repair exonuclease SbcCD ATPase subunit